MENLEDKLVKIFLSESEDNLDFLEEWVMQLENSSDVEEIKKDILRTLHTLKGSSAVIESDLIPNFIHSVEESVKNIFSQNIITKKDGDFILSSVDYIRYIISELIAKKKKINMDEYNNHKKELDDYRVESDEESTDINFMKGRGYLHKFGFFENEKEDVKDNSFDKLYKITFYLTEKRYSNSWFPEEIISEIGELGEILLVSGIFNEEVEWRNADFAQCYFHWTVLLKTKKMLEKIKDVFLFFENNNTIEYELLDEEKASLFGEILVNQGKLTKEDLEKTLLSKAKLGEILVENKKVTEVDVKKAVKVQTELKKSLHGDDELKISTKKVNALIDLVGELVITNSNLDIITKKGENLELDQVQYSLNKVSKQMRDLILALKMVPIGQLMIKYHRIVRDLSDKFNKKINFVIEGESTEVDKSMFNILQEPLLHIIRNCVDHGIESREARISKGKNEEGTITIKAYQENGGIVIMVKDDGAGLDKEKIYKKAVNKGFLKTGFEYSDDEIYSMIFEPGFSTKDKTTLVSGRGVGMDVVQSGVKKINGTININSKKGKGTEFIIKLPLTLAIIEGFLIRIGEGNFVFPLNFIYECFEIDVDELEQNEMVHNLRGNYLSIHKLSDRFSNIFYDKKKKNLKKQVVVVEYDGEKTGVLVDEIIGNIQAVIKPISKISNKNYLFSGSTVLGDGRVALILDINNLTDNLKAK